MPVGDTVTLLARDAIAKAMEWVEKGIDPPGTIASLKIVDGLLN